MIIPKELGFDKKWAINFKNYHYLSSEEEVNNTIEFRIANGTLDRTIIQNTIHFYLKLMLYVMRDEYVAVQNTAATAEGAIAEAIKRSPRNLSRSQCMVLGYGRCGSTLALLLRGFSCHLTVVEQDAARAAGASVLADRVLTEQGMAEKIGEAEFIFNTVPEKILNREALLRVKKSAWIFDLASSPGGADYPAASELSLNVIPLPGLPGKYSPATSAEILAEYIRSRLDAAHTALFCEGSVV